LYTTTPIKPTYCILKHHLTHILHTKTPIKPAYCILKHLLNPQGSAAARERGGRGTGQGGAREGQVGTIHNVLLYTIYVMDTTV
jgi:hypothetical protein